MFRRFALLPLLVVPLLAQEPAWQEFTLGPARGKLEIGANNIRQGVFRSNSISLKTLISVATGVPVALVAGPPWMESDHYSIAAILAEESRLRLRTRLADDPRVVDEFRSLLTQELVTRFRLQYHRETRDMVQYTLQPLEGANITLQPSTARERGRINLSNTALTHHSTLDARGITVRSIGSWLQGHLKAPVTVSPMLPDGVYNFRLQWKSNDDLSLMDALKSQLGAELLKQTQRQEFLVIDRVEKPGPALQPEPAAPVTTGAPDSSVTYVPSQLRRDLRVLRDALEEAHPGIYRFTPKAVLDRSFQRAEADLTRQMTALQFYRVLAPLVAQLKCGHTALQPSSAMQIRVASEPLLPIEAAILNGKVYVARDFSDDAQLAGVELLAINDVPAAKLLATMLAVVHGDGDSATAGPYRLSHRREFARNLYLIAGLQSPFLLRYSAAGKTGEAVVNGLPLKAIRDVEAVRYPENPATGNATWKVLADGATGLLKVRGFSGNAEGEVPMSAFFDRVFTEIRDKKIPRLILDVRDNGGGDDELGRRLFAFFADQPFLYYRDLIANKLSFRFFQYAPNREPLPANINELVKPGKDGKYHVVSHPNWGVQQPAAPHFGGKTVVLMNGGSFSTTCEFLSTLHHKGGAAFVGEETAGGYYGNTSGADIPLVLPNSKLVLPVQLVGYYLAIEGNSHGTHGIRPDYAVDYSIADVVAGRDPPMETALRVAVSQ